jgi:hypothetical protein
MPRPSDPPILLVKWYDLTKWLLERVESFPKGQRFVFGQRLADRSLAILETLVDEAWSPPGSRKAGLLARANPRPAVVVAPGRESAGRFQAARGRGRCPPPSAESLRGFACERSGTRPALALSGSEWVC